MAYSRPELTAARGSSSDLDADLVSIGFVFGVRRSRTPADLEATLVRASLAGLIDDDLRVLAMLTTWLGVHSPYVNVARLCRMLRSVSEERVLAYWSAIGEWRQRDRRYAALSRMRPPNDTSLLREGSDFQISRHGPDARFEGSALVVPAGVLRDREEDVLSPAKLTARHAGYRNRVRMGPNWRADVWTILEAEPGLSASEAARRAGCSFAVAWEARRDFAHWSDAVGE